MTRIALAVVVLAVTAAPAAAAQKPGLLTVKQVGKPPASIQVGATFTFAVRIANSPHRQAAGGRVTVTLRTKSRKRKLAGATLEHKIPGGATSTLTFTIPVSASVPAGTYDLVACVRRTGRRQGDCKTARTLKIVG